jgi:hypothetical protein
MTDRISPILTAISACVCAQLEDDGLPPTCVCTPMPGQGIAADYGYDCKSDADGMAWTRLVNAYPASSPGVQGQAGQGGQIPQKCGTLLGVTIEVGIIRSIQVADTRGRPVPPQVMADSVAQQNGDMMAMYKAFNCCEVLADLDWALGVYAPAGPQGGVVGGAWQIYAVL